MKITLLLLSACVSFNCFAQRFETKEINYRYVQFPLMPVKGVDNYNSTVLLDYEHKNQALRTAYDQGRPLKTETVPERSSTFPSTSETFGPSKRSACILI